ncbi:hypothetical protein MAMC_02120 [Methylacidimicrobium cyclopophantes]|uniref:Uncharacterized protein n=1 Tax=Methylacidimicrobium cyclopophantes TaxID=1041766 RepID=A0A5E6MK95_9BACT|nr:hypothetical protein [Methylacidimicrobium cyclopophantes]VVM08407.1 hypothetical protein MAMC_02120 [Methylacidimicrobium cyclopophantes]
MSPPSASLLLRLEKLDPESGLFASFPGRPPVPLLRFAPLPTTGARILSAIGSIDENAPRLLSNFQRRFPAIYEAVESIGRGLLEGEESSPFFFLSVCSVALQAEESDLRETASLFSTLQVDYALLQKEEQWFLDTRTTLRSLWGYKLADVPNALLLRSLFASLGQTLGAFAGRCGELLRTETILLSGDLLPNPFLREGLRRGLPRKLTMAEHPPAPGESSTLPPIDGMAGGR